VKSEPGTYSWDEFAEEGGTCWDGVRNSAARLNLIGMRNGDPILFYHSVTGKEVVGVARVARESYPDPTSDDPRWVAVDLVPVGPLRRPVTLAAIRADPRLARIALVRQSRLSVMRLGRAEFLRILSLGETRPEERLDSEAG
jgi:predicted RNA-binding protein with PUA-like domain